MNYLFEERKGLFKIALNVLNITDNSSEINWDTLSLERLTPNWEIHPILWYGIEKRILPFPAEKIARKLRETYLIVKATARLQNLLLEEILQRSWQAGIEICLLKGIRLSREYYPDIGLRPTGDIDILVKHSSKRSVDKIFKEIGAVFESRQGAHDRYVFPEADGTVVEIHFRLINTKSILQRIFFPANFLEKIPWDEMTAMKEGGLKLPNWFEHDYLHLHALKEGYKSLKWVIDIALMDAGDKKKKAPAKSRFISNARAMTYDIGGLLMGQKNYPDKRGPLWDKAVSAGATGNAGRWHRLLMAMACGIPF